MSLSYVFSPVGIILVYRRIATWNCLVSGFVVLLKRCTFTCFPTHSSVITEYQLKLWKQQESRKSQMVDEQGCLLRQYHDQLAQLGTSMKEILRSLQRLKHPRETLQPSI